MNEFAIEWEKGGSYAGVTVPSGTALKNKLKRLAVERPDEVRMMVENPDGSAFFHVPVRYVHVNPPRAVSEDQREAMRNRSRAMWQEKKRASAQGLSQE